MTYCREDRAKLLPTQIGIYHPASRRLALPIHTVCAKVMQPAVVTATAEVGPTVGPLCHPLHISDLGLGLWGFCFSFAFSDLIEILIFSFFPNSIYSLDSLLIP